jgi:single-stranded-DNA-specific exonuclease
MDSITKRWQIPPALSPEADKALEAFPPVIRQILYNRGYTTYQSARNYLEAISPEGLDPFNMIGVRQAVERLVRAIQNQELIAIYGDYDADGVTATALMVQALKSLNARVIGYIPNRFDEGYGLNNEALEHLQQQGVGVVVTVDCGIRSPKEAAYARNLGLDLIISDHHQPDTDLPNAYATINPKQAGDPYPEKELAGVGLAYKLVAGLLLFLEKEGLPTYDVRIDDFLDLVALGTVADLAPLVGENRSLVRGGLRSIRRCKRQGLLSLLSVTGVNPARITATDIGFIIGPRLNAAGRLESALASLQLLTTNSLEEAGRLAQQLDNQNRERQRITQEIQAHAEEIALAECPDGLLLSAAHPNFNPGVVGLAASRLTELYYRPSIVAYQGEEFTRASCRSIPEFHITNALDQCASLLEHHGGHAAAAGFTVRNENYNMLIQQLQRISGSELAHLNLCPTLVADVVVPLKELHARLLQFLELLQPTGYGNSQATFVTRNLKVSHSKAVGKEGAHLKLTVTDGWVTFDAIAFRQGHWHDNLPPLVDLLYNFELNEFNGRSSLQLNIRDIKASGAPD